MTLRKAFAFSFFLFIQAFLSAHAEDEKLISGPGSTLTENKCKICHELQHIRRAELSPGEWADNLRNMKERGAPMTDAEMEVIHRYLSTYYNRDKPAPAPSPDTLAGGGAGESPAQQLFAKHGCGGCHALDARVVGPALKDISKKYPATASSALASKIRSGSQGAWGNVPMPPNAHVPESDARTLAEWILSLK